MTAVPAVTSSGPGAHDVAALDVAPTDEIPVLDPLASQVTGAHH